MNYLKTRSEMIGDDGYCSLCFEAGFKHRRHCLLHNPGTTHIRVMMSAVRAKVVIRGPRDRGGKCWWRSPVSKKVYDIDRRGRGRYTYFLLSERESGETVMNGRLCDIKAYIVDNQGVL